MSVTQWHRASRRTHVHCETAVEGATMGEGSEVKTQQKHRLTSDSVTTPTALLRNERRLGVTPPVGRQCKKSCLKKQDGDRWGDILFVLRCRWFCYFDEGIDLSIVISGSRSQGINWNSIALSERWPWFWLNWQELEWHWQPAVLIIQQDLVSVPVAD